jgi:hypothetical protein
MHHRSNVSTTVTNLGSNNNDSVEQKAGVQSESSLMWPFEFTNWPPLENTPFRVPANYDRKGLIMSYDPKPSSMYGMQYMPYIPPKQIPKVPALPPRQPIVAANPVPIGREPGPIAKDENANVTTKPSIRKRSRRSQWDVNSDEDTEPEDDVPKGKNIRTNSRVEVQ